MAKTKININQLNQDFLNGWIVTASQPTYASANTMTVPSGAASIYQKGDKVRFKQGAGFKYMYIIAVADTVLTLTGGSDYTVANSSITEFAYSHQENPIGFPQWFICASPQYDVTTLDNNAGGQPTSSYSQFCIRGQECTLKTGLGNGSYKVGSSTLYRFTIPLTLPVIVATGFNPFGSAIVGSANYVGLVTQAASNTTMYVFSSTNMADNLDMNATNITATYRF